MNLSFSTLKKRKSTKLDSVIVCAGGENADEDAEIKAIGELELLQFLRYEILKIIFRWCVEAPDGE